MDMLRVRRILALTRFMDDPKPLNLEKLYTLWSSCSGSVCWAFMGEDDIGLKNCC